MATNPPRLRIPTLLIGLIVTLGATASFAACGGDDDGSAATTAAPATSAAPVAPVAPAPVDTVDVPVAPPAPVDSSDIVAPPPPPDTADLPVLIDITVGVDSGVDRIESVPVGSIVSITLTNPGTDDEFHLHGYDLGDGQEVAAGESVTFTFTADTAGEFELESHATDAVLLVLRVV
jgi:hypothetical protein